MAWIQMDTNLEAKPEYVKLLGLTKASRAELTRRIFQLWCWIDTATEDGFFVGLDESDLANQFEGTTPEFWKCFEDAAVQWLAFTPEGIEVPGYEKRFSQSAKKRANDARRAALKRSTQSGEDDESQAMRQKSQTKRRKCDLEKRREEESKEDTSNEVSIDRSVEIRQVFEHYRKHKPNAHRNPTSKSKEWRNIRERLQEGSTVEELCQAIDGCFANPWNQGQNPNGKPYNSLELITRNASKVQQFIDQRTTRGSPAPQKTNRPSGTYQGAAHDEGF